MSCTEFLSINTALMNIQFSWDIVHVQLVYTYRILLNVSFAQDFWGDMKTSCPSETSKTIYGTTPRHIPEKLNLCKIDLPVHILCSSVSKLFAPVNNGDLCV